MFFNICPTATGARSRSYNAFGAWSMISRRLREESWVEGNSPTTKLVMRYSRDAGSWIAREPTTRAIAVLYGSTERGISFGIVDDDDNGNGPLLISENASPKSSSTALPLASDRTFPPDLIAAARPLTTESRVSPSSVAAKFVSSVIRGSCRSTKGQQVQAELYVSTAYDSRLVLHEYSKSGNGTIPYTQTGSIGQGLDKGTLKLREEWSTEGRDSL